MKEAAMSRCVRVAVIAVVASLSVLVGAGPSWAWVQSDYTVQSTCGWSTKIAAATPTFSCTSSSTTVNVATGAIPRPAGCGASGSTWGFSRVPSGQPAPIGTTNYTAPTSNASNAALGWFNSRAAAQVDYDVYIVTVLSNPLRVGESCGLVGGFTVHATGSTTSTTTPDPSTVSTCTSFRHITAFAQDGTVDVTFAWAGVVPPRGWDLTDAGKNAAVGAGTVLRTVPGTPVESGGSLYGFTGWAVPAGVGSLRLQVHGTPGCFTGFTVARDASGNVTGLTAIGSGGPNGAPDISPDTSTSPNGTDEQGANCGRWDIFCQVRALFIPNPSSWGFASSLEQVKTRAPFSVVTAAASTLGTVVTAYSGADGCGIAPAFPLPYFNADNTGQCYSNGALSGGGWLGSTSHTLVMGVLRLMLYGWTLFVLWGLVEGAFGDKGGDE